MRASLADLVRAPPLVMQVLTSGPPALASTFLADDGARIDELLAQTPVRSVLTSAHEHRVVRASYAADHGRASVDLRPVRILGGAGPEADEGAKEAEQARLAAAEAELAEVAAALAAKARERAELEPRLRATQARFNGLLAEQRESAAR